MDVATSPPHSDAGTVGYDDRSSQDQQQQEEDASLPCYVRNGLARGELTLALHPDSAGGTYFVLDSRAKKPVPVAVFKPADEEIGQDNNPHGNNDSDRVEFVPGSGYLREVLAYCLDYDHHAGVPETHIVTINNKIGSLHRFIPNCSEAGDHVPGKFSVEDVHRIAILDIRLLNGDRHGGNILVQLDGRPSSSSSTSSSSRSGSSSSSISSSSRLRLVPIDHSYVIPPCFVDPDFEWLFWPQSQERFSPHSLAYIASLDVHRDQALVAGTLGQAAGDVIAVTTLVLKYGAANGRTCRDIAGFCRRPTITQPSALEQLLADACGSLDDGGSIDLALAESLLPAMMDDFMNRQKSQ